MNLCRDDISLWETMYNLTSKSLINIKQKLITNDALQDGQGEQNP